MKNKQLIIFDLDGTLIDSIPALAKSVNHALIELKMPTYSTDTIASWVGNGAEILIKRALCGTKEYSNPNQELYEKAKELMLNYYKEHLTYKCNLFNGAKELLEYLYNNGYILAIATNKPNEFVEPMLKDFKIDKYFKLFLGAGVVENKKPHPQLLLKICNDLNISNENTVMIGDSSSDIKAAKSANIDSIALTFGYNQGINLKELSPTLVFDSLTQLKEIF